MDSKQFRDYVIEQKRIGLTNSQIARKLGMDAGIFEDACKFAFEKAEEEEKSAVPDNDIKEISEKPRKEKVPGIYYVPQNDDDEFMNTPIVKKKEPVENAE